VTSAVLLVAVLVLVLVELSYRRWMRRSIARRREVLLDLERAAADVIPMPARDRSAPAPSNRIERQSS
jgi:hypothetical protein